MYAANGNTEAVLRLLDVDKVNVNTIGRYGSALIAAAYQGHQEMVTLLLGRGAHVNITGGDYGSALGAAASRGHQEIVSLLLDHGADVNITGGEYSTALTAAASCGYDDIVSLLILRGADVNMVRGTGQYVGTALTAAALHGHKAVVLLLLMVGANTNIVSGYYGTALAAASISGFRDIISMLLEYPGTDINAIGGQYGTALGTAFASVAPSWDIPGLLRDHGADINLVGCMYGSLLGKAAYQGNKILVLFLLADYGADPFHVGGEYETPTGEYPTALDAARAGEASEDIVTMLSRIMHDPFQKRDTKPWPPFPMPFRSSLATAQVSDATPLASALGSCYDWLETIANSQIHTWDGNLTPAQADLPCKAIDEGLLKRAIVALVGIRKEAAERLQVRLALEPGICAY